MGVISGDVQVVRDETIEEYHDNPAYSKSNIKVFVERGPLAFLRGAGMSRTNAMLAGSILDAKLTGEGPDYIPKPANIDLRTKSGKEWKRQQIARGVVVVGHSDCPHGIDSPEELFEWADDAVAAIRAHSTIGPLLMNSEAQVTLRTLIENPFDGVTIQGRPDFIDLDMDYSVIIDLKKTAMFNDFERQAYNLWYDVQHAMTDVQLEAMGVKTRRFYWLVVSDKPPAQIKLVELSPEWIELGRKRFFDAMHSIYSCKTLDNWPRTMEDEVMSYPPKWAKS